MGLLYLTEAEEFMDSFVISQKTDHALYTVLARTLALIEAGYDIARTDSAFTAPPSPVEPPTVEPSPVVPLSTMPSTHNSSAKNLVV